MASHDIDWTPGAHVCFGSLDFIITTEGELARAPAAQTPLAIGLDDHRGSRGVATECSGGPRPRARLAPRLQLREARALAHCLPGTSPVMGGSGHPHLLLRQHQDVAR
jgi:hypothetical protein